MRLVVVREEGEVQMGNEIRRKGGETWSFIDPSEENGY